MFRKLKEKGLLTPLLFLVALLFVLSLIIIIGQLFHQTLQDEMATQFNKQQLMLAREIAVNIESFVDSVYKDIFTISQLPEIQKIHTSPRCRVVAEAITAQIQSESLVTVQVINKNGILLYDSAAPGREGRNLSSAEYFKKARTLERKERLITDLLEVHGSGEDTKEFVIATPIFQAINNKKDSYEFQGVVLAVLSMDGLTKRYLTPIKSGAGGYAWMMDDEGTLLFHHTMPGMVGKNLYAADQSCFTCHKSFKTEQQIISGAAQNFGYYEAPGGENKLLAFYKIRFPSTAWFVVVSAPYSDVISLMQRSRQFYSLLIVSIFITTLAASGMTLFNYKKKIKAEERAAHLENQRRLEREIELAKNFLENIIENTKTNLLVLEKDLTIKTLNSAQAKTFGRPKEQLVGKGLLDLFPEGMKPYVGIPFEALLRKTLTGRSFEIKDYEITGLGNGPVYLDMNVTPLLIENAINGILITSMNVTKRFQLEEALKRYTVELEDKVDRETATTRKLQEQVVHSEKLAALGRLAAGVAHEIGNPLTSISTFAQMLREMATEDFSKSSLDIINNHIQRITDIVRQMSTFARPDAVNIRSVQLNEVLNSSLDLMRLDKRMKSTIAIRTHLDPELPRTMIDEGQVAQVFVNIILNALDAMPEGGTLTVSTHHGKDEEDRDAIFIEFADTGVGMPASAIEKIFDPFYTTKEAGKGTGLGLSVSYNIIKRFKGEIRCASEEGRGTIFTVILPVTTE